MQTSVYFLPHVLFRTIALSLTFAFLGYYSFGLVGVTVLIVCASAYHPIMDVQKGEKIHAFLSLVLALLAPISFAAYETSHQMLMKRAITMITSALLFVLTTIFTLPYLIENGTLVDTRGLCHINFHQPLGHSSIYPAQMHIFIFRYLQ